MQDLLMMSRADQREGKSLLVGAPVVATLLGVSVRTVNRWVAEGELPPPIKTPGNGVRMWRRRDIEQWVDAGCSLRA